MPSLSESPAARALRAFRERYGAAPEALVRAPGRVNLIGEHTDYNDGFVLPMAVDRAVWIALRPRADDRIRLHSLDFSEDADFRTGDLDLRDRAPHRGWSAYAAGCAWALRDAGHAARGWDGVVAGDVPRGAGLSSSAALGLAVLRAFAVAGGLAWDPSAMARLAQRAENAWVGVGCGIMDPLTSAAGVAGHALLIDCRTLDRTPVPLPDGTTVVILDTATRRGLVDSAYNERRRQCEAAARAFGVAALRDVTPAHVAAGAARLDATAYRRARHVGTENAHTRAAADALADGDAARLGRLMNESHESLRDDFEVSGEALDRIAAHARAAGGCFGARMTGAGFAGCAVALVAADAVARFAASVSEAYRKDSGRTPALYPTAASAGASVEDPAAYA